VLLAWFKSIRIVRSRIPAAGAAFPMSENEVIANQKTIMQNQKTILFNQAALQENPRTIKGNQISE
jgi:hypothetical protein